MNEMQKYYNDVFEYNGNKIEKIPDKYRTRDMWISYMKNGGPIQHIPKEYKNKEFYKIYISSRQNPIFASIPEKYRTKELCELFFKRFPTQLYKIPEKFITPDMWSFFIKNGGSIKYVPEKYINEELCKDHILSSHNPVFDSIPVKYRTKELCELFFKRYPAQINKIPAEYITSDMWLIYLLKYDVSIKKVPSQFINTEFIEKYWKDEVKNASYILETYKEYINEKLIDKVFDFIINSDSVGITLNIIPKEFLTNDMVNKYIDNGKSLSNVPIEFITDELCYKYIKLGGNIKLVPKEFLTDKLCVMYVSMGGNINGVPTGYRTQELFDKYLELGGDINQVPKKYLKDEKMENKTNSKKDTINLSVLEQFKEYLLNTGIDDITKKDIVKELGLSSDFIDRLLDYLSVEDPDLYEKVKEVFMKNKNKYYFASIKQIKSIEEILNIINYKNDLTKEQKIYFSYLYGKIDSNTSIIKLYQDFKQNNEFSKFLSFCKKELGLKYSKLREDTIDLLSEEKFLEKNVGNWLSNFYVNQRMSGKGGKQVKYMYLTKNDEQVEITLDIANMIIEELKKNSIATKVCIVEESFRRYANGELEEFINDIVTGEYLNNNIKSKTKKQ